MTLIHFVHLLLCLFFPQVTLNPFFGAGQIGINKVIYFKAQTYSIESLHNTRPKATLSWSVLLDICLYCLCSGKEISQHPLKKVKLKQPVFRTSESFHLFLFTFFSHTIYIILVIDSHPAICQLPG